MSDVFDISRVSSSQATILPNWIEKLRTHLSSLPFSLKQSATQKIGNSTDIGFDTINKFHPDALIWLKIFLNSIDAFPVIVSRAGYTQIEIDVCIASQEINAGALYYWSTCLKRGFPNSNGCRSMAPKS